MAADAITRLIASYQNELLTSIDLALDNVFFYSLLIIGLLLLGEHRTGKRMKVMLAMVVALAMTLIVNVGMAVERPCIDGNGIVCPMLYSFPSFHCALAFILMISFLNKRWFPIYLVFALFVAFSRIHLGVHMFRDVAGALVVGLLAYNIAYLLWERWRSG